MDKGSSDRTMLLPILKVEDTRAIGEQFTNGVNVNVIQTQSEDQLTVAERSPVQKTNDVESSIRSPACEEMYTGAIVEEMKLDEAEEATAEPTIVDGNYPEFEEYNEADNQVLPCGDNMQEKIMEDTMSRIGSYSKEGSDVTNNAPVTTAPLQSLSMQQRTVTGSLSSVSSQVLEPHPAASLTQPIPVSDPDESNVITIAPKDMDIDDDQYSVVDPGIACCSPPPTAANTDINGSQTLCIQNVQSLNPSIESPLPISLHAPVTVSAEQLDTHTHYIPTPALHIQSVRSLNPNFESQLPVSVHASGISSTKQLHPHTSYIPLPTPENFATADIKSLLIQSILSVYPNFESQLPVSMHAPCITSTEQLHPHTHSIPPPTPGNAATADSQSLRIQTAQSLNSNLSSQLPFSMNAQFIANTERLRLLTQLVGNQDNVNVELKDENTMFGLIQKEKGSELQFLCNFCLIKSKEEQVFMNHVASHLFVCGFCPYQAFTRVEVVRHIRGTHSQSQANLENLQAMHLDNVTLKPSGQSMDCSSSTSNTKSESNVLDGHTIVECDSRTCSLSIPNDLIKTMTLCSSPWRHAFGNTVGAGDLNPSSEFLCKPSVSGTKTVSNISSLGTITRSTAGMAVLTVTNPLASVSYTHVAAPPRLSTSLQSINALPSVVATLINSAPNPGNNVLVHPATLPTPKAAMNIVRSTGPLNTTTPSAASTMSARTGTNLQTSVSLVHVAAPPVLSSSALPPVADTLLNSALIPDNNGLVRPATVQTPIAAVNVVRSTGPPITSTPSTAPGMAATTVTNPRMAAPPRLSSNASPTVESMLPNSAFNPGNDVPVHPATIHSPTTALNGNFLCVPRLAKESHSNADPRLGMNFLGESVEATDNIFCVSFPTAQPTNIKSTSVVNDTPDDAEMYQCSNCQFHDHDFQVVRTHQIAHTLSQVTVALNAYGVVCPHCLGVYKTIPFFYEHLDIMHKSKPPSFFLIIRCTGAKDTYWFCPCCNIVKSEKQKQVVWQHVLSGHDVDNKFCLLKNAIMFSRECKGQYITFLGRLWMNSFMLNNSLNCTIAIPKSDSVHLTPVDRTTKKVDNKKKSQPAPVPAQANSEGGSTKSVAKPWKCPFRLLPGDIHDGFPSKSWLAKHSPSCKMKMSRTVKHGVILTIKCGNVPKHYMPFKYKDHYSISLEGLNIPECKVCGKSFNSNERHVNAPLQSAALAKHMLVHFDIFRWMCPYCLQKGIQYNSMVSHLRNAHGELPKILVHTNPIMHRNKLCVNHLQPKGTPCQKPETVNSDNLIRSMKGTLEGGEQVYVFACSHCKRQVMSKCEIMSHIKFVHPQKPFNMNMLYICETNYDEEIRKIKTGVRKAVVSVVRVEDMEKYEELKELLPHATSNCVVQDYSLLPNDDGKYECGVCGYRSIDLETTRSHMLQDHPGEDLSVSEHAAEPSFDSQSTRGRMLYLCPSCTFFSNKREAMLVHAGLNPSHFSNTKSEFYIGGAETLIEKQTSQDLCERTIKPVLEKELELPTQKPLFFQNTSPCLMRGATLEIDEIANIRHVPYESTLKRRMTACKSITIPAPEIVEAVAAKDNPDTIVGQTFTHKLTAKLGVDNAASIGNVPVEPPLKRGVTACMSSAKPTLEMNKSVVTKDKPNTIVCQTFTHKLTAKLGVDNAASIEGVPVEPPLKIIRVTACKSSAKPTLEMNKSAAAKDKPDTIVGQTMTKLRCSHCDLSPVGNITFMKYHFSFTHPCCAIVAMNDSGDQTFYICPDFSCTFIDKFPAIIHQHLISSHDGDPKGQRFLYSDAALALQQLKHFDFDRKSGKTKSVAAKKKKSKPILNDISLFYKDETDKSLEEMDGGSITTTEGAVPVMKNPISSPKEKRFSCLWCDFWSTDNKTIAKKHVRDFHGSFLCQVEDNFCKSEGSVLYFCEKKCPFTTYDMNACLKHVCS